MSDIDKEKGGRGEDVPAAVGVFTDDGFYDPSRESTLTRLGLTKESFKRAPGTTRGLVAHGDIPPELQNYDNPNLQQKMRPRHLQMIAVGGAIGTGLFVGSGGALATGGPAAILIAWIIMGVMLINVTQALGEMAILYPVSGGFFTLVSRFLDPSLAFALGWNYVFSWMITLPLELTVAGSTVMYWSTPVPLGAWITIFYFIVFVAVMFGTLGYAETEFWTGCLKLIVIALFIVIAVVCVCGGGPTNGAYGSYVGAKHYHDPGAFAAGFKGFCAVLVTAAFAYAGSELVSFAATETPDPRATMPSAIKNIFWRVIFIYITLIFLVGLAIPYNEPLLQEGDGANGSPLVILFRLAKIRGLDHLVNATILISVLAMSMSCIYGGSRPLVALAEMGYAPKFFATVDKAGRPMWALMAIFIWGPLAYVNIADVGTKVFDWLLALSGLCTLYTWLAICVTHLRFRKAWRVQGHSLEELPFKAFGGIYGSWMGIILICLVIIAQFYTAVWPVGEQPKGAAAAEGFFQVFVSFPIVILFYIVGFIWKRSLPRKAQDIDLDTGRKSWLTAEDMRLWREKRADAPWWKRLYRVLFC
ncbi:Amino acid permease [Vanrija albida]|uniref:Amino acid permease n=1 Tax=Vanrija albida TaxID=181172 RepID=A0ABR3QC85_9TREE